MKSMSYVIFCAIFSLIGSTAFAAPEGDISFHNGSNRNVTAQVSPSAKFQLAANQQRSVSYSTLSRVCSQNPCTAHFYVDDKPAGSATIDTNTGKVLSMRLKMKVHTVKGSQHELRNINIQ